jgi:hypothetical protein
MRVFDEGRCMPRTYRGPVFAVNPENRIPTARAVAQAYLLCSSFLLSVRRAEKVKKNSALARII